MANPVTEFYEALAAKAEKSLAHSWDSGDATNGGAAADTLAGYIFEAIAWAKRKASRSRSGSLTT